MITEKQIFDVLNKYQSSVCILPNEKCIDPMDFHKVVNEIMNLINMPIPDVVITSDCGHFISLYKCSKELPLKL